MSVTAAEIRMRLTQKLPLGEAVTFSDLNLDAPLNLDGLDLCSFDLSGVIFQKAVSFRGARLSGLSWFKHCIFESTVDFKGASFANDARFDDAVFMQDFVFSQVEIHGATDFSRCHFLESVNLDKSVFFGNLSLAHAQCDAPVSMRHSECLGGLWASGANFTHTVDTKGMDVHGRLWLRDLHPSSARASGEALASRINAYGYQWL